MPVPKKRALSEQALELVAARFRVLGEPARLRLLQHLEAGERSVGALAELLGTTQPNVSKHLKVLQEAGLVSRRREGTTAYYGIADDTVSALCDLVCSRLADQLEALAGALERPRRR